MFYAKFAVEVYSRPGCHPSDDGVESISNRRIPRASAESRVSGRVDPSVRKIGEDPELRVKSGEEIPVVWIDGINVFKHACLPEEFRSAACAG